MECRGRSAKYIKTVTPRPTEMSTVNKILSSRLGSTDAAVVVDWAERNVSPKYSSASVVQCRQID